MLEQTPNNAAHADAIADSANSGAQSAHSPHDKIDFDSGLRCPIKRLDDGFVEERIHLGDDARRTLGPGVLSLALNQRNGALCTVYRGDEQRIIMGMISISSEKIENFLDSFRDFLIRSKQAQIGIKA